MSCKVFLIAAVLLSFLVLTACGTASTPDGAVKVLPKDCRLKVGEQMPLTLNGLVPPNAMITWDTSAGSIISAPPALNAVFIAPPDPAIVTITVTISSGTPSVEIPIKHQCIITSPDNALLQSVQNGGGDGVSSPISQVTPETDPGAQATVIISEVMANPCGPLEVRKWNEYVELYNHGNQPVDVGGWWLADSDIGQTGAGTPDQLVSWSQRNPNDWLGNNLVLNSTVIPARGFALVISPIYTQGAFPYTMPYHFPANTVILTIASSRSLGDDYFSIIGDGQSLDVLVLYKGGASVIQEVVSTYGTPKVDQYVTSIRDDDRDNLPFDLHECSSAERIKPAGADSFDNWREIPKGSPGESPY